MRSGSSPPALLAAAALAAACAFQPACRRSPAGSSVASAEASPSAAPAPGLAAPAPQPLDLPPGAVPSPRARSAFLAWSAARAGPRPDGSRVRHALFFVDDDSGGTHRIVVRELVTGAGTCSATLRLLLAPRESPRRAEAGPPPEVRDRDLGRDCCDEAPCAARSPEAWVLHLQKALVQGDRRALQELVHPERGLRLVSRCHGDGCVDDAEQITTLARSAVEPRALVTVATLSLEGDEIACAEQGPAGFSCSAHGGGYEGAFAWARVGPRAYLTEIRASGH